MQTEPHSLTAPAERVMAGLLAIAADAMRKLPKEQAAEALANVQRGTMALSFNVSMTGQETAIVGAIADVSSGVAYEIVSLRVNPVSELDRAAGLH